MLPDPASLLVVELGLAFVVFLLFPLVYTLARLPAVWAADRGVGLLVTGIVVITGFFFILFFIWISIVSFPAG